MITLELIAKPLVPLGLGAAKNLIQTELDEKQGYTEPLQNVADHVTGTLPFVVGVINMFTKTKKAGNTVLGGYGDVLMGSGGSFLGEAITKAGRKYAGGMGRQGGVSLELESPGGVPAHPQPGGTYGQVAEIDHIHGEVV